MTVTEQEMKDHIEQINNRLFAVEDKIKEALEDLQGIFDDHAAFLSPILKEYIHLKGEQEEIK